MFARTKRLALRPGWLEDAPALAEAIGHEDVLFNLASAPSPYRETHATEYLERSTRSNSPNFLVFARTGGAPRLIGGCGLRASEDGNGHELGYWISRPFWGLGFATEAAQAVMSIARATGLTKITAFHAIDNHASARVLYKLGFRPTGQISRRRFPARNADVSCIRMEDAKETVMREDTASLLYPDLVAA